VTGQPYNSNGPAIFSQDSNKEPYIIAKPNEQFLEVHLWSRYYGETYARGDWTNIFFVLMWCISNIPDCEVWYGGDSSGVCLELMTFQRLKAITQFYLTSGHGTYWMNKKNEYKFLCEFCNCSVVNSGGGGDRSFWHCDSCGSQWVVVSLNRFAATRITKYNPDGEDHNFKNGMALFDISSQIEAGTRTLFPFDGVFHKKYF